MATRPRIFYDPHNPVYLTDEEIANLSSEECLRGMAQLDQNTTACLQRIDGLFSRMLRTFTQEGGVLDMVEKYGQECAGIWDNVKFFRHFFETAAQIRLSPPSDHDSFSDIDDQDRSLEEAIGTPLPDSEVEEEEGGILLQQEATDGRPPVDEEETVVMKENKGKRRIEEIESPPRWATDPSNLSLLREDVSQLQMNDQGTAKRVGYGEVAEKKLREKKGKAKGKEKSSTKSTLGTSSKPKRGQTQLEWLLEAPPTPVRPSFSSDEDSDGPTPRQQRKSKKPNSTKTRQKKPVLRAKNEGETPAEASARIERILRGESVAIEEDMIPLEIVKAKKENGGKWSGKVDLREHPLGSFSSPKKPGGGNNSSLQLGSTSRNLSMADFLVPPSARKSRLPVKSTTRQQQAQAKKTPVLSDSARARRLMSEKLARAGLTGVIGLDGQALENEEDSIEIPTVVREWKEEQTRRFDVGGIGGGGGEASPTRKGGGGRGVGYSMDLTPERPSVSDVPGFMEEEEAMLERERTAAYAEEEGDILYNEEEEEAMLQRSRTEAYGEEADSLDDFTLDSPSRPSGAGNSGGRNIFTNTVLGASRNHQSLDGGDTNALEDENPFGRPEQQASPQYTYEQYGVPQHHQQPQGIEDDSDSDDDSDLIEVEVIHRELGDESDEEDSFIQQDQHQPQHYHDPRQASLTGPALGPSVPDDRATEVFGADPYPYQPQNPSFPRYSTGRLGLDGDDDEGTSLHLGGDDMDTAHGGQLLQSEPYSSSPLAGRDPREWGGTRE